MAANDLCTLADVRQLMQKKSADTTQDAMISSLITRASVAVMQKADREFAPVTASATRTFEWPWGEGDFVSLAPYDLRTVTQIQVDTDQANPITLSTDEWRLWPQPPRDGTYIALRLQPFSAALGRVMWRQRQVQVTGSWGFAAIPGDIIHATALTVRHWVNINTGVVRNVDDVPDGMMQPKRGIPPEAMEFIWPYKRAVSV